jgi:hypothetical protein
MTERVQVSPMPLWVRRINKFRPQHPPIFPEGVPTDEERELAKALIAELDQESQEWYGDTSMISLEHV